MEKINQVDFNKLIIKIKILTEINYHNQAFYKACEFFEANHICEKLKLIMKIHEYDGHLNIHLSNYIHFSLKHDLKKYIEQNYDQYYLKIFEEI